MTELKRKTDAGHNEADLGLDLPLSPSTDPVDARYQTIFAQHMKNMNTQIGMAHANNLLRIENDLLKAENERLKKVNEELFKKAYFDHLTGLPNQRLLEESFNRAVEKGDKLVVLFIDLNKFKPINDTYGHHVGDEALKLVSNALVSLTRSTDIVTNIPKEKEDPETHLPVRFAGDEFIILFTGSTLKDLEKKINDVKSTFSTLSLSVENGSIPVGASIGAYEYQTGDSLKHCIKQADDAMFEAKKANNAGRDMVEANSSSKVDTSRLPFARFASGYSITAPTSSIPSTSNPLTSYLSPKPQPQ